MKKHLTATACAWIAYIVMVILICLFAGFLAEEAKAEPTVCGVDGSNNLITANLTLMPYVDKTKNCTPMIGASDLRIKTTTELPTPTKDGAFRIECFTSHMANDDPIVYPGQPGKSHHHTFFGNTTTNANSDLMDFANVGNSTCKGGIMNRSAYWVPSMIDTTNGTPIKPDRAIFYYKTGGLKPGNLVAPPKGLRMISGNAGAKTAAESTARFTCIRKSGQPFFGWQKTIPACVPGETMQMMINFPQCWDGVNLDSPDHKSHMAYTVPGTGTCPATHPIGLPQITLGLNFVIVDGNQTAKWRLASDNYFSGEPAGYSAHADWVNGWNEEILQGIVKNCLNASKDCHGHLLGDGRTFFGGVIK